MARDKDDVLEVLRDPTIRRLYFSVGPIIVTSEKYNDIYDRVEQDKITTSVVNVRGTNYDHQCSYHPGGNHITLNTSWTRFNLDHRANLIHECTHAIVDIEKITVRRLYDEVAAYVAQNTYLLLYDPDRREYPEESSPLGSTEAIYRQAMQILLKTTN